MLLQLLLLCCRRRVVVGEKFSKYQRYLDDFLQSKVIRIAYVLTIGGRGVGNFEGDQPNFGWGWSGFWTPRGGNKFCLSEGGKGGE